MRRSLLVIAFLLPTFPSTAANGTVQFVDRSALDFAGAEPCADIPCSLSLGREGDLLRVEKRRVSRHDGGAEVFDFEPRNDAGIEAATLSGSRSILFLSTAVRTVTRDANVAAAMAPPAPMQSGPLGGPGSRTGAMFSRSDTHRNFKILALNAKSGVLVKEFDLGQVQPKVLRASSFGETLLVLGFNVGLRKHEVLAVSARSGEIFHRETVYRERDVALAANGYAVGGQGRLLTAERAGGESRFTSRDQFSMAEFIVACEATVDPAAYKDKAFAFLRFENAEPTLDDSMSSAAAIALAAKGLTLVERRRMDEILREVQFQSLGVTSNEVVADIGRLGNAQFLVIGSIETIGADANVGLRAIDTETGAVVSGCAMRCRDCKPQDYAEGVGYLVGAWVP